MKKKSLVIIVLIFLLTFIAGCAFFPEDAEGVKDIELSKNDDNDLVIKVLYYDDDDSYKEEVIPSGLDGRDGVGIESVVVVREKDSLRNKITIKLTPREGQENGEEYVFYVPDGVRIESVESKFDEGTGKQYMTLKYSDGDESEPLEIPEGKPGNGIETCEFDDQQPDGSTLITLTFTDGTVKEFTIPAGKTGKGIQSIRPDESNGKLTFIITYDTLNDNGENEIEIIEFTRSALWFQGFGGPTLQSNLEYVKDAIVGDYYLDLHYKKIYTLRDSGWELIVDFAKTNETFTVTLDLNDDDESPCDPYPYNAIRNINYGEYLLNKMPPLPTRAGYTFVGWATKPIVNQVTGYFTDLTPVMSNLTIYAIWQQDEFDITEVLEKPIVNVQIDLNNLYTLSVDATVDEFNDLSTFKVRISEFDNEGIEHLSYLQLMDGELYYIFQLNGVWYATEAENAPIDVDKLMTFIEPGMAFIDHLDEFEYNEKNGQYVYKENGLTVSVRATSEKILNLSVTENNIAYVASYSEYGFMSVNVPQVAEILENPSVAITTPMENVKITLNAPIANNVNMDVNVLAKATYDEFGEFETLEAEVSSDGIGTGYLKLIDGEMYFISRVLVAEEEYAWVAVKLDQITQFDLSKLLVFIKPSDTFKDYVDEFELDYSTGLFMCEATDNHPEAQAKATNNLLNILNIIDGESEYYASYTDYDNVEFTIPEYIVNNGE